MSDSHASSRLSGPPNAGYATARERKASDVIMLWMRQVERSRVLLLTIVVSGLTEWRRIARPQWRPHGLSDDTIDEIYRVLAEWAGANPAMQLLRLHGQMHLQEVSSYDLRMKTAWGLEKTLRTTLEDFARETKGRVQ